MLARSYRLFNWASLFEASRLLKGGNNLEEMKSRRLGKAKLKKSFQSGMSLAWIGCA